MKYNATLTIFAILIAGRFLHAQEPAPAHTFAVGKDSFLLDGKPFVYRAGEMHPSRIPPEYWEHRLKMAKAMGLNTVGIYLFWNLIEQKPGELNWTGLADAARFCRLAQKEGLWVILRPGPYVCAEWEEGGHPWWLLKNNKVGWRSTDPAYLDPALRYLKEVGRVLAPLQITRGGPIILYQVENEYAGKDQNYLSILRQAALDNGFDIPLIACNPPGKDGSRFASNYRDDLFQTANFGRGGAASSLELLKRFKKSGPYANGEFYPGWFDSWGRKHQQGSAKATLDDLEFMLKAGCSFSIYMAHGGTNFGFWAGANGDYSKIVSTSYDYDAPISESGGVTEKFTLCRELFSEHLQPGESLPDVPAPIPTIGIPAFALNEVSPVSDTALAAREDETPKPMELYDQGYGAILYRTTLPAGPEGDLSAKEVHDFGYILVDGVRQGIMDRRQKLYSVHLPARTAPVTLDIFVEAMGRPNGGGEMFDRKGVHAPVLWSEGGAGRELKSWRVYPMPLDAGQFSGLKFTSQATRAPAFLRGGFDLEKVGDTFLDTRKLGKGMLWINGHNLGRYWNIGPQQTLFCPGAWLKTGRNEVVVLDYLGASEPSLAGLTAPVLDELHPEWDFAAKPPTPPVP